MNLISVIVPCWNEEETIPIYYEHMCPVMDAIDADCELIFVDDGSFVPRSLVLNRCIRKMHACRWNCWDIIFMCSGMRRQMR